MNGSRAARLLAICFMLAATAGCEAILGVEDVVRDGEGGSGGAGSGTADATVGVGAGFGTTATTTTGGPGATTTGDAASSSSTGQPACSGDLPPCPGAAANEFEGPAQLGEWTIERKKAEIKGGKLELDPDDSLAFIRSKAPIDASGACAVWVAFVGGDPASAVGIAVGDGTPGSEVVAVYRQGETIGATSHGASIGSLAASPHGRTQLRIRFDGAGSAFAEAKGDLDSCYEAIGGAVSAAPGPQSVSLFQLGEHGKSQLDDYCR